MSSLYRDRRLYHLLIANTFSSVGTGMTLLSIPWLLVQKSGGETLFGYITLTMTIMMFILTPYTGVMIDRFSRKTILFAGEALGFTITTAFAFMGFAGIEYQIWHLAILYASGVLYYFLFYPTLFALNQELFDRSQYKQLNGILEIQGQLATVLSGGIASILMAKVALHWILLLDVCTYLVAIYCLWKIPYHRQLRSVHHVSFWHKMTEGYRYMRAYPSLFWFLLASFMPFIGVMMTNYLHPIYISTVLKEDGSVYGTQSMMYGLGAALAGLVIPFFIKRIGNEAVIVMNVGIYTIAITMFLVFQHTLIFYMLVVFMAFGNAGTRVARSSLMMELIPNDKIGRVDSLFRAVGLMIRVLLLSVFTGAVSLESVMIPYAILSAVLFVSLLTVLGLMKNVKKEETNMSQAM
jgi:MFS family permease